MIYCMADLHGERDFFLRMLEQIRFSDTDHLYILGDVIDRGTGGIDLLKQIMEAPNMTMLLGNHEQMCLSTLGPHNEFGARELWRQNGGATTYRELLYHCTHQERNRILRFLSELPDALELTVGNQNSILSTVSQGTTTTPASGAGRNQIAQAPIRTPSASSATPLQYFSPAEWTRIPLSGTGTGSSTSTVAAVT